MDVNEIVRREGVLEPSLLRSRMVVRGAGTLGASTVRGVLKLRSNASWSQGAANLLLCANTAAPHLDVMVQHRLVVGKARDAPDSVVHGSVDFGPVQPSSLVRFLPVSRYLLEPASGVWVLGCGVLTSREA